MKTKKFFNYTAESLLLCALLPTGGMWVGVTWMKLLLEISAFSARLCFILQLSKPCAGGRVMKGEG